MRWMTKLIDLITQRKTLAMIQYHIDQAEESLNGAIARLPEENQLFVRKKMSEERERKWESGKPRERHT